MSKSIQTQVQNASQSSLTPAPSGLLQRKCAKCEEEEATLQRKPSNKSQATPPVLHEILRSEAMPLGLSSPSVNIQHKLKIGAPNDKYEQEADRVAEQVVRMPEPHIQRQVVPEEEEEEDTTLRMKYESASRVLPSVPSRIQFGINQLRQSNNTTLPETTRAFMESRFSHEFKQVKIHNSSQAANLCQSLNARAFTIERDIFFNQGEFRPGTDSGKKLLAHELTHVVQQEQLNSNYSTIQKIPKSKDELEGNKPRYSYSDNCGWIDWGHANPTFAKKLLDRVREASKQMFIKETPYRVATYHQPKLVFEEDCPETYDTKEKYRSKKDPGNLDIIRHKYGIREYYLGGFEIGKSDSTKFDKFNAAIQSDLKEAANAQNPPFSVPYSIFVKGFTDCLDSNKKNLNLRSERAKSISTLLYTGYMTKHFPYYTSGHTFLNEYIKSNSMESGRQKNRGVLILAIPEFTPDAEEFETPMMTSSFKRFKLTQVKSIFDLKRSLKYREQLGVALWIFEELTKFFEAEQIWTESVGHSSFSNEDLPSNLIGFYMAVMNKKPSEVRKTVEPLCKVYDPDMSKVMFELYEGRWSKTHSFIPPGFENVWPAEFTSIIPIPPSKNLYELIGYEGNSALTWFFEDAAGNRSER